MHVSCPLVGELGKREQPRTRVLATFGVVGRGRGEAMRPLRGALLHAAVEIRDGQPAGSRIAADLIEGQQPMKAI